MRYPLYLDFLRAFGATPEMTTGRLFFALATTGYIFVAMNLDELDRITPADSRNAVDRRHFLFSILTMGHACMRPYAMRGS